MHNYRVNYNIVIYIKKISSISQLSYRDLSKLKIKIIIFINQLFNLTLSISLIIVIASLVYLLLIFHKNFYYFYYILLCSINTAYFNLLFFNLEEKREQKNFRRENVYPLSSCMLYMRRIFVCINAVSLTSLNELGDFRRMQLCKGCEIGLSRGLVQIYSTRTKFVPPNSSRLLARDGCNLDNSRCKVVTIRASGRKRRGKGENGREVINS